MFFNDYSDVDNFNLDLSFLGLGDSSYNNYDYSASDFPNTIWYIKGSNEIIVFLACFLPPVLVGLTGNLLVIYILATDRHCRTPTNLLICNMAVADMVLLILNPWIIFVYNYFQNYQLGPVGCKGEGPVQCIALIASVITMSAITYDRLTAIVLPNETRINKKKSKIVIALTWIVGTVFSIPLGLYRTYKERLWKNFDEKYCTEDEKMTNMYWFVIVTVLVGIPLIIQIICYTSIFIKLHKYEKILVKAFQDRQLGYKRSAARMIFIVILTFTVCRIPFVAYIIYRHQMLNINERSKSASVDVKNQTVGLYQNLWYASKYLLIVNAAINPFIYAATNVAIRNAFKKTKLLKWLFPEKKPQTKQKTATTKEKIFYIFKKKPLIQPTDTSTKVVEILNTKL